MALLRRLFMATPRQSDSLRIMNTKEIVKQVRPNLRTVAPKTAYDVRGFGVFNLLLSFAIFFLSPRIHSIHIVGIFPLRVWSAVFFAQGAILLYGLLSNHWQSMKRLLLISSVITLTWALELFSVSLQTDKPLVLFLLLIAVMLAYLEAGTFLHFTPEYEVDDVKLKP